MTPLVFVPNMCKEMVLLLKDGPLDVMGLIQILNSLELGIIILKINFMKNGKNFI